MELVVIVDNEYLPDVVEFIFEEEDSSIAICFAKQAVIHAEEGTTVSIELRKKGEN